MFALDLRPQTLIWAVPFLILWFAGEMLWPYLLAIAGGAILLARRRNGRRRAAWLIFAGFLIADCLVFRVLTGAENRAGEAHAARLRATLSQPAVINGLALPAGTAIVWRDDQMTELRSLTLPSPTPLLGVVLTGELNLSQKPWTGTLAADMDISGWRCRAGFVSFWAANKLFECTLAAARRYHGQTIPAGARIGADPDGGEPTIYSRETSSSSPK